MYLKQYDIIEPHEALLAAILHQALRDVLFYNLAQHSSRGGKLKSKADIEQAYEFFRNENNAFRNIVETLGISWNRARKYYQAKVKELDNCPRDMSYDDYKNKLKGIIPECFNRNIPRAYYGL